MHKAGEDISQRRYFSLRRWLTTLTDRDRLSTVRSCSGIAVWPFEIVLVKLPISAKNSGDRFNRMRMPPTALGLLGADIALMDHVHRKGMILQRQNTARVGGPNKPGIHPDIVLHEPVAFPVLLPITQLASQQPHAVFRRVHILVGTTVLQIVVQQPVDSANLDSIVSERLYLITQTPRRIPIVIIPMRDDFPARMLTRQIELRPQRDLFVERNIKNSLIRRHQIVDRIRAVIDYDQFPVRIVLVEEIFNRMRNELPAVVGRHDAGNQWVGVHFRSLYQACCLLSMGGHPRPLLGRQYWL